MKCGVQKVSAHCATDDFGVPEVNGAREGDGGRGTKARSGSNDRTDVSGILHGVEDENPRRVRRCEVVEGSCGRRRDGEDALRRVRLGGTVELGDCHGHDLDAARSERLTEGCTARGGGEIGRGEGAGDCQGRAGQLFDGTNAFDNEEAVPLASFPPPKVTR